MQVLPMVFMRVELYLFMLLHIGFVLLKEFGSGLDFWGRSPIAVLSVPTGLLAFFVVFFNGHCYTRFLSFYGATTGMMGATQELIELIAVHLADEPEARWDAIRYAVSSILLTYMKVEQTGNDRKETTISQEEWESLLSHIHAADATFPPLLTYHEVSMLIKHGNTFVPLHAWTIRALKYGFSRGDVGVHSTTFAAAEDCVLRIRRSIALINNTLAMPIPLAYFHMLNLIMYVNYTLMAFSFTQIEPRLSSIFMFIALIIFTGLREMSAALSNPFGEDDVDFPIKQYMSAVRGLASNMAGVTSKPVRGGKAFELPINGGTPELQLRNLHEAAHQLGSARSSACFEFPPMLQLAPNKDRSWSERSSAATVAADPTTNKAALGRARRGRHSSLETDNLKI
jgi:predicted membrane chloride channel (bestrophin family)